MQKYEMKKVLIGDELMPIAKVWRESEALRLEYDGVECEPDGFLDGSNILNLWTGFKVKFSKDDARPEGDWDLLREHIRDIICKRDLVKFNFLMLFLADLFQDPSNKKGCMVAFKGKKGTGKTKVAEWVREGIGARHSLKVTHRSHVTGQFNSHLNGVLLLVCEEAFWAGDKEAGGVLKDHATSPRVFLVQKFKDGAEVKSIMRLMFISNEEWIVPAGFDDERRIFVVEVDDHWSLAENLDRRGAHFEAIDQQMESGGLQCMVWDLMHLKPEKLGLMWNDLRNPPKTEELKEQAQHSLLDHERFWVDLVKDGEYGFTETVQGEDFEKIIFHEDAPTAIHSALLGRYYKRYLGSGQGTGRQVFQHVKHAQQYLGAYETNSTAEQLEMTVIGRDDGRKGRTIIIPPLKEIRALHERKGWITAKPDDAIPDAWKEAAAVRAREEADAKGTHSARVQARLAADAAKPVFTVYANPTPPSERVG
jgi:hypothetical protein